MRGARALVLLITFAGLTVPTAALGQDRDRARVVFDEATSQFDQSNFSIALEGFREAQSLMEGDRRAQLLIEYNIARANEELSRYSEALTSYETYLAEAPPDAPYLDLTRNRVRELRLRLGLGASDAPSAASGSGDVLTAVGIALLGAAAALGGLAVGFFAERERNAAIWNGDDCLPSVGNRGDACDAYELAALDTEAVGIGLSVAAGVSALGGAVVLALGVAAPGSSGRAEVSCGPGPGLVGLACGGTF